MRALSAFMRLLAILSILIILSACIPAGAADDEGPGILRTSGSFEKSGVMPVALETTTMPPATPTTTRPAAEQAARAQPLLVMTPTLPPSATPDPLDGFQICTPLNDILLEDLPRLISDGYHPPPVYYSDERHPAIDIAFYNWKGHRQIAGTPVQSVLPGWVTAAEADTFPMGNVIIIETRAEQLPPELRAALDMADDRSLYILYAHMQADSLQVSLGQSMSACQTIGQVGKTGNTLAPHLHLETRLGPPGASFDGFQGYIEEATIQEKRNYRTWTTSGQFLHFDPMRLLMFYIGVTPTPGPRH